MHSTKSVGSLFPEITKLIALYESQSGQDIFTLAAKKEMAQIEAAYSSRQSNTLYGSESHVARNSNPNASVAA